MPHFLIIGFTDRFWSRHHTLTLFDNSKMDW